MVVIFFMFMYLFGGKEKAGKGVEREERERIPSRFHAISTEPNVGLDLSNCEIVT